MKPTRVFAPLVALACFFNVSCAPVTEEATRELGAQEYGLSVLRILPDGWQLMECRVDDAPSRWSGRTRALVARFRHESLVMDPARLLSCCGAPRRATQEHSSHLPESKQGRHERSAKARITAGSSEGPTRMMSTGSPSAICSSRPSPSRWRGGTCYRQN